MATQLRPSEFFNFSLNRKIKVTRQYYSIVTLFFHIINLDKWKRTLYFSYIQVFSFTQDNFITVCHTQLILMYVSVLFCTWTTLLPMLTLFGIFEIFSCFNMLIYLSLIKHTHQHRRLVSN